MAGEFSALVIIMYAIQTSSIAYRKEDKRKERPY
jgi:hypothetical protein